MATRLYLGRDPTPPGITLPAADAGWEKTAGALTGRLKGNANSEYSNTSTGNITAQGTSGNDTLLTRFLSAALDVDQTITGTIKGQAQFLENNAGLDARSQSVLRVVKPDLTIRGTLLAMDTAALANEFAAAMANRRIPRVAGTALTSVAALAGDRLLLEVGFRQHATIASSGAMRFGAPGATDLAEDETTTTANNPWIELSQTITFVLPNLMVSQVVAGVFYRGTPQALVSQVVGSVFYREPANVSPRAQAIIVG